MSTKRRTMGFCPAVLALVSVGLAAGSSLAWAQPSCPPDTFQTFGKGLVHATPTFTYVHATPTWFEVALTGPGGITVLSPEMNWPAGTGRAHVVDLGGSLRLEDRLQLNGVAPGTSLPLQAVLDFTTAGFAVQGVSGLPEGAWEARLTSAGQSATWSRTYDSAGSLTGAATLTLPITLVAGEEMSLVWEFEQFVVGGGSRMEGQLRFEGLPEGVEVVTCKGYSQLGVPVEPVTWGRIKARF